MKTVVISFLGTVVDNTGNRARWDRWRPTVSLCQHEDLIIDRLELLHDERSARLARTVTKDIGMVSPETDVVPHIRNWKDPWDFEEVYGVLREFCQAYSFNNDKERYLVHLTTGTHVAQICWFLLTESRHLPGQLIQSSPPNRNSEPQGSYSIIDLDLSRYDSIAERFQKESIEGQNFLKGGISTRNKAFNKMMEEIENVAIQSRAPILIMGPTGAGKTELAKRIYALKKTRKQVDGEFISINCGTLRGDAAMATLFGHTKGAFTGANVERSGLLKSADKGILFLDEIAELGLDEQAMLLHAIEEKSFRPLGSDKEVKSDFEIIAGTNKDLSTAVSEGTFREDLMARLNLWTYQIPGLSQRKEDIEPNIQFECLKFEQINGRKVRFNKEAMKKYLTFAKSNRAQWIGNFRDLSSSICRMATLAGSHRINIQVVDNEIDKLLTLWNFTPSKSKTIKNYLSNDQIQDLDTFDVIQLEEVLKICEQSKSLSDAGRTLFQSSREKKSIQNDSNRIKKYLERFDITWKMIQGN